MKARTGLTAPGDGRLYQREAIGRPDTQALRVTKDGKLRGEFSYFKGAPLRRAIDGWLARGYAVQFSEKT